MNDVMPWLAIGVGSGLLLLLPTLLLTRWLRRLLIRRHSAGVILSLYAGALLRGLVVLLGGLVVFLLNHGNKSSRYGVLGYWVGILLVYIVVLTVEIHSIIGKRRSGAATTDKE